MRITRTDASGNKVRFRPGWYPVEVVEVVDTDSVKSPSGNGVIERLQTTFGSDDGSTITHNVLVMLYPDSLLWQIVESIFGEIPESFDSDDLIGHRLMIEISEKSHGDKSYLNVTGARNLEDWDAEMADEVFDDEYVSV